MKNTMLLENVTFQSHLHSTKTNFRSKVSKNSPEQYLYRFNDIKNIPIHKFISNKISNTQKQQSRSHYPHHHGSQHYAKSPDLARVSPLYKTSTSRLHKANSSYRQSTKIKVQTPDVSTINLKGICIKYNHNHIESSHNIYNKPKLQRINTGSSISQPTPKSSKTQPYIFGNKRLNKAVVKTSQIQW